MVSKSNYRMCIKKKNLNENNYNNLIHWLEYDNHIYIGRNMTFYVKGSNKSKWSNPFTVKKYGLDDCLHRYRIYIQGSKLIDDIDELRSKILGCWCEENSRCHADVLIDILYNN